MSSAHNLEVGAEGIIINTYIVMIGTLENKGGSDGLMEGLQLGLG